MKQLNLFNKILAVIILILIAFNIYRFFTYKSWDRYYFSASVTVPEYFPIHVETVSFNYPNDDLGHDFYQSVDEVNKFYVKWGEGYYFPEAYESLLLPKSVDISYYDYRSRLFYKSTIALPEDVMRNIFKEAEKTQHYTKLYNSGGDVKGLVYVLGIANNANIMLWLKGDNYSKLVLKTQLKPVPFSKSQQGKNYKTENDYFKENFRELADSLKIKINNGYQKNANYIDSTKQFIEYQP